MEAIKEVKKEKTAISKLIESGIPVKSAVFHAAVNDADGTPETSYSLDSHKVSRQVEMWYSPAGLICYHFNKISKKEKWYIVPLANVIFADFKV